MALSEQRRRSLFRQAERVAESGKRAAAAELYRQIIREDPQVEAAWLGLAAVSADEAEKSAAFTEVLSLNPDNEDARLGLAILSGVEPPVPQEADSAPEAPGSPFDSSKQWLAEATARLDKPETADKVADISTPVESAALLQEQKRDAGQDHADETAAESFELFCYRHPKQETSLRCYSCGQPICSSCAVKTPVGYRCPTCIREAEAVFFTATPLDYLLAPLVAIPLSLIAGYAAFRFGGGYFFLFLMLFIGGAVGRLIGQVTRRVIGRRRGRYMPHLVAATIVIGVLVPVLIFQTITISAGIYLFVASSAAFYQMK